MNRPALLAGTMLWALGSGLGAQSPQPRARSLEPKAHSLHVFLVTVGEGSAYWEKFGHNALAFIDTARRIDVTYNWGIFDFREPGYLGRVISNDLRYWVEGVPTAAFINSYRGYDRTIVVQRLNLTAAQAQKAFEYAQWNVRDENKYYRYDYFLDNCSTRVRDLIDLALDGELKRATAGVQAPRTYRLETLRLVDDMKLTQFAINAALAQPADKQLTVWENMFVPSRVRDALREVTVADSTGRRVPVVAEERVMHESQRHSEREDAPRLWFPYLIFGLIVALEFLAMARMGYRSRGAETTFRLQVGIWAFLTGVLGVVLLLGWAITEHAFWRRNENLLLVNPLSLFLMVLAPLSMWRARWTRPAAICAVIIAMLSALALVLKGIPILTQDNLPMIALLLPTHFAVAYGFWRRAQP